MKTRKLLAMLLTLSMVMSLAAPAFADSDDGSSDPSTSVSESGGDSSEDSTAPEESSGSSQGPGETPENPDEGDGSQDGDSSETPEEPGEVTDSENPGEVTDPENPGEVVDPENPGEVVDPENPGEVVDPENPGEVVDPENPGEVVDPENPGEVVDPENPGEVVDPENPGEVVDPENPGEVVDPENPGDSSEEKPGEPGEIVDPEKPDVSVPEQPPVNVDQMVSDAMSGTAAQIKDLLNSMLDKLSPEQIASLQAKLTELEKPVVAPVTGSELYDRLMAAETWDEFQVILDEYMANYSEEELEAEAAMLTEEQIAALEAHREALEAAVEPFAPPVEFTDVGPLIESIAEQVTNIIKRVPMKTFGLRPMNSSTPANADYNEQTADCAPDGNQDDKNMTTHKTLNEAGNMLTIEAWSSGTYQAAVPTTKPADIVLVLDQSGSMYYCIGCGESLTKSQHNGQTVYTGHSRNCNFVEGYYTTGGLFGRTYYYSSYDTGRQNAMLHAVNGFLDTVGEKNAAIADAAQKSRVAIVTYTAYSGWREIDYDIQTRQPLTPVTSTNNNFTLSTPNGGTPTHKGMEKAKEILDAVNDTNRNKVVVLLTDGVPGMSGMDESWATAAISCAGDLKAGGATIYTVGIFDGANPDRYKGVGGWNSNSDSDKGNHFMNAVSSNCTSAVTSYSTTLNSTNRPNSKYYLTTGNEDGLDSIFEQIAGEATSGSNVSYTAETQVRDVITPYFQVSGDVSADGKRGAVRVYTTNAHGENKTLLESAVVEYSNNTVNVSGFDFSAAENAVKEENGGLTGRKLIIEIDIEPNPNFWGGNNVPTNISNQSGVFTTDENGEEICVKALETGNGSDNAGSPKVNVLLKDFTVQGKDTNIYYGYEGALSSSDMVEIVGDIPNDWRTEYINTTPSVKDPDGGFDRTKDSTYIISVTVSPKENGAASAGTPAEPVTKTAEAKVNVFIPTVTFGDMRTYLTVAADVANHTPTSVVWMHDGQTAETVKMEGTAPALTYTIVGRVNDLHGPGTNEYNRDYYAEVKEVFSNGKVLPDGVVKFDHNPCDDIVKSIPFDPTAGQFLVHVFKPVVTFKDTTKYKGEALLEDYTATDYVSVRWEYNNSGHVSEPIVATPEMIPGTAPVLTYTYTTDSSALAEGLYVKDAVVTVAAEIGGTDVTTDTKFEWVAANSEGCTESCAKPENGQFTVHVLPCQLTVRKVVNGNLYGENDTFIFTVTGSGNALAEQVNLTIVLGGQDHSDSKNNRVLSTSQVITDLPVGTYTVTEDTSWSWRYKAVDGNVKTQELGAGTVEAVTVTITNTQKDNNKWLSSEDFKVNTFNTINKPYPSTDKTTPPEEQKGEI